MAGWYFSVNGRAEGPVAEGVIVDGLKSGRFTLVDLVFREGSQLWTTIGEVPQFREAFQALAVATTQPPETPTIDVLGDEFEYTIAQSSKAVNKKTQTSNGATGSATAAAADAGAMPAWVVLSKEGSAFRQTGPFTEAQILEGIGKGTIEYSMYAWKAGYKRWVRIGNLPEFDRRKRDRENDPVNLVIPLPTSSNFGIGTIHEIGKAKTTAPAVEVQRRDLPPTDKNEPAPSETNGVDLASHARPVFVLPKQTIEKEPKQTIEKEPKAGSAPESQPSQASQAAQAAQVMDAQSKSDFAVPDAEEPVIEKTESKSRSRKKSQTRAPFYKRAAIALVAAGLVVVALVGGGRWWVAHRSSPEASETANEIPVKAAPSLAAQSKAPAQAAAAKQSDANQAQANPEGLAPQAVSGPAPTAAQALPQPTAQNSGQSIGPAGAPANTVKPAQQAPGGVSQSELGFRPLAPGARGVTVFDLVPLKLQTASPLLVFQTDAAVGEVIDVKIRAKSGDILQRTAYSYETQVRRQAGEIASLDLSHLSLPQGTYTVDAGVGRIRKTISMFVGVRDAKFESERQKHIKAISMQQQEEKKALFYSAQALEKLSQDLGESFKKLRTNPAKWKKAFANWKKDAKAAAKPAMRYSRTDKPELLAYPESFQAFDEATEELANEAHELDAAVSQKRNVASSLPLNAAKSFKKLRTDAAKLTSH